MILCDNQNGQVDIVVLMAGEGQRMRPLTNDRPKALLCCDDSRSIFHHLVRSFASCAWQTNVIPVIGHGRAKVNEELVALKELADFQCVYNPFYATAGPLISLWLGLIQSKNNGVIILNGDTLIKQTLAQTIVPWMSADTNVTGSPELGLCVSEADSFEADDLKILVDGAGKFIKAGKELVPNAASLKSAGVICVRDYHSKNELKAKVEHLLTNSDSSKKNYYWHNLLNEIKGTFNIDLIKVNSNSWHEVDTVNDLRSIQ